MVIHVLVSISKIHLFVNICRDFDKIYNPIHGNCFMFNSGWSLDRKLLMSRNTGRRYGNKVTPVTSKPCLIHGFFQTNECYKYNFKLNSVTGLHVVLNIHQDQYIKSVGQAAGLRVLVTSQNTMPFPEEEGLHIQPGYVTSLGVRQVKMILA